MILGGLVKPKDLLDRLQAEATLTETERRLVVLDATVRFERSDEGPVALADLAGFEKGHITGARFLDHEKDLSVADAPYRFTLLPEAELQGALRSLGLCSDSTVIIYSSQHVMWATRLWWILSSCGLTDVYVLDGGLAAWTAAGLPLATESVSWRPGDVQVNLDSSRWANKSEVEAAVGSSSVCTIDALQTSSFDGTSRSNYGRPGHIEGSVNAPFDRFVDGGSVRSAGELRSIFDELGAFEKERVVTYCGGGIAATLAAFVLHHLGHANVGVYDGSLSEWGADPSAPMALGEG